MNRSRHDELRALAEAATPGPWEAVEPGVGGPKKYVAQAEHAYPRFTGTPVCATNSSGLNKHAAEDAAYIAAVSPDVLLGLLDELAAAEARAAELERERERAEKLIGNARALLTPGAPVGDRPHRDARAWIEARIAWHLLDGNRELAEKLHADEADVRQTLDLEPLADLAAGASAQSVGGVSSGTQETGGAL